MQRLIVSLMSIVMTLGGEKNLAKVQGLTAAGTYQREMGDRQL